MFLSYLQRFDQFFCGYLGRVHLISYLYTPLTPKNHILTMFKTPSPNLGLRNLLLLVLATICTTAMAMSPQAAAYAFATDDSLAHASVGICVLDIHSGQVVAEYCPDQSLVTASTMKVVTAASALYSLGPDFTFSTKVFLTGNIDKNGVLHGNIVVQGGGDPTLGSKHFADRTSLPDSIASLLTAAGVKSVEGTIITDTSLIPFPPAIATWQVEDLAWDYGAGCFGLCYADNVITVSFNTAKNVSNDASVRPWYPEIKVKNMVSLYPKRDMPGREDISALMDYAEPSITLWGQAAINSGFCARTFANPAPHLLLKHQIAKRLGSQGITVNGEEIATKAANRQLILDYPSPPLSEILLSMLTRSDNLYAEMVLRAIGINYGKSASIDDCLDAVAALWLKKGLDTSALFMKDGSGLSRNGRASARFLCQLLSQVQTDNNALGVDMASLLPLAGESGTVARLLKKSSLKGTVALKSGSMNGVHCYAGYYPAQDPKYAVAILVNAFNGPRADLRSNIEQLLINLFVQEGQ